MNDDDMWVLCTLWSFLANITAAPNTQKNEQRRLCVCGYKQNKQKIYITMENFVCLPNYKYMWDDAYFLRKNCHFFTLTSYFGESIFNIKSLKCIHGLYCVWVSGWKGLNSRDDLTAFYILLKFFCSQQFLHSLILLSGRNAGKTYKGLRCKRNLCFVFIYSLL